MIVGLGTGSTAAHFVRLLAERKLDLRCAPTSEATHALARSLGMNVIAVSEIDRIDVTVDGADEVDGAFRLIKGGGGALLREKIVAAASDRMVVIADAGKSVETLGRYPLPVEVTPFGHNLTAHKVRAALRASGCAGDVVRVRQGGEAPFLSDGGNYILDCECRIIPDPEGLAAALAGIPGVVEHGLFIGLAHTVIIGRTGGAERRDRLAG